MASTHGHALRPLGRVLGQHLHDHVLELARDLQVGRPRAERLRLLGDVLGDRGQQILVPERAGPGQHLVGHRTERVDVAAMVVALAANALGRQIVRRADHAIRVRLARRRLLGADQPGDAEIDHLDHAAAAAAGGQHDVVGLDVEMDDAFVVGRAQGFAGLAQDRDGAVDGEVLVHLHDLAQGGPVDVLHHEEDFAV
jgi:hypothetical protein